MSTILVFGDASYDQTFITPRLPVPDEKVHCEDLIEGYGGVALNTAIAAARAGAPVRLVAQIGSDIHSRNLAGYLSAEQISADFVETDGRLARVTTIVEPHGEKRLLLYPGVSLYPPIEAAERLSLDAVAHIHTAPYGPAGSVLVERARAAGIPWSIDLEPATFSDGLQTIRPQIDGAQIVLVNDRAAEQIGPDAVEQLLALGARAVLRSRGPSGAILTGPDGILLAEAEPREDAPIRDTTGAGDCLAGWYLARSLAGETPSDALTAAVEAATRSCGQPGTHQGYPRLARTLH